MNFDEAREQRFERERTFQIGGETFTAIPAVDMVVVARYEDAVGKGNSEDYTVLLDATIKEFLVAEDRPRWDAMRERVAATNGITFGDAAGILRWLLERDAQRPTEQSSSSFTGTASGEGTSADASDSPGVRLTESPSGTAATPSTSP